MRFLLDECAASKPLHTTLVELGHDVLSVRDHFPRASDEELLMLAYEEKRVLITEDNDFGELVFLHGLPHPAIVRLVGMTPLQRARIIRTLIERHSDAMLKGTTIVVTGERMRIRRPENYATEP